MKQAKLSFVSKRTTSTNAAAGKNTKSTRKQPARASSSPTSSEPIIISDSDSDESSDEIHVVPAPKKRRLDSSGLGSGKKQPELKGVGDPAVTEPENEREPLNLSDPRWRKLYGSSREKMGNLEPVHANGQSMVHHILRVFDLSYEYGPCVGVSRLDRWERAHALGLNPPPEVKEILLTKEGGTDEQFSQSVFHGEV
ncbi:DNA polymerase delta, subunit 4-domain-containing protein [Dichomitus squalens]|uniref:DNA polymerase delta, subunit 4-domain-containing protein n=1 Tax=Dichomitus squalens TaxID=114155 RepID=A0A4Q9PR20_9APHY|nr:DNA polymerase delta, subunit 4-domain-containing protein [Dichomitus squalens]